MWLEQRGYRGRVEGLVHTVPQRLLAVGILF